MKTEMAMGFRSNRVLARVSAEISVLSASQTRVEGKTQCDLAMSRSSSGCESRSGNR
jgi:hypothetical protein